MGMGFAPTWLRQLSPPGSQNHFNHCCVLLSCCDVVASSSVFRDCRHFRTRAIFTIAEILPNRTAFPCAYFFSFFLTPLHGRQKGHPAVRPLKILHPTIHNGSFWKT